MKNAEKLQNKWTAIAVDIQNKSDLDITDVERGLN